MEANFTFPGTKAQEDVNKHFEEVALAVRLGQSTFPLCRNNTRMYSPGNELQTNSSFIPEVTVFC